MSWKEDTRTLLDQLEASYQAAVDATDEKDVHIFQTFAQDAASQLAWRLEVALMETTLWDGSW